MSDMRFIEPCLPTISRSVPTGPQWAYEIKHDGFRFLAVRHRKQVRIYSRGGHDWSKQLPAITEALQALPVRSVVLGVKGSRAKCGIRHRLSFSISPISDRSSLKIGWSCWGLPACILFLWVLQRRTRL